MFSRRFLRIKVVKAIYAHINCADDPIAAKERALLQGIDKAYDLYPLILSLIVEVKRYAEERQEIALRKHLPTEADLNPNRKFVNNALVAQLEADEALDDMLTSRRLGWGSYPEFIRHLYQKMTSSEYYTEYMASPRKSYAEDRRMVEEFFLQTVQDDEMLMGILEDSSLMWSDDIDYIMIMVMRTLGSCKASQEIVPLLPQYKSEEDEAFARRLFGLAAAGYNDNLSILESYTRNWDVERIAVMDNVILTTALAELLGFDSIPVKVTLDEYIEIAKYYSTLSSSNFINGILDKITTDFTANGRINKQGRGLVEF